VILDGQAYHKVLVSFDTEGGGEDYQDRFVYYFHSETFLIDFLSYEYATNGGGQRFRVCTRRHRVGALVLQDYDNYRPGARRLHAFGKHGQCLPRGWA
ncbi:MAG: hypothetical protein HC842_01095, partial [Cytophagales bacterium]|nr:hypothetical protein [Cytophagales bacterium]